MANEYLIRTSTSTGNRKVFTWSGWVKQNNPNTNLNGIFAFEHPSGSAHYIAINGNAPYWRDGAAGSQTWESSTLKFRDLSSWSHFMFVMDTTLSVDLDRAKVYVNGILQSQTNNSTNLSINEETYFNRSGFNSYISNVVAGTSYTGEFLFTDIFYIDGQALTPDVFGFYKQGNGYISAGSTQATDFRPGQWVPKTPRIIKTEINRRGGFGVNGFYLPMNDSSNFGADFHTTPNSIITLKGEDLQQPRNGAPETTDAYVSQLRTDPYAANLVLAVPGISGGQGSGYGDYSADIKGSGSNKTVTANGNAGIAVTASYYGSAMEFTGVAGTFFSTPNSADFNFGSEDFTIEAWINPDQFTQRMEIVSSFNPVSPFEGFLFGVDFNLGVGDGGLSLWTADSSTDQITSSAVGVVTSNQWNHVAVCRYGPTVQIFSNGVCVGIRTNQTINPGDSGTVLKIGEDCNSSPIRPFDGKIQDLRIYKGVAKYKGGFDVTKPYTPVGIGTWRAVPDTTANNFATMNAVVNSSNGTTESFSNGNLTVSNAEFYLSTVGLTTGKWYWEHYESAYTNYGGFGIDGHAGSATTFASRSQIPGAPSGGQLFIAPGRSAGAQAYRGTTTTGFDIINLSHPTETLPLTSAGNVYAVALDLDGAQGIGSTGAVHFYINGTEINQQLALPDIYHGISTTGNVLSPFVYGGGTQNINFGQNPTFSGNITAGLSTFTDGNGKGLFRYEPPSGFLALCEDNLPTPAIKNPGEHFKTVLWTGDGNSGHSIAGVGFTPDLVWGKSRTTTHFHTLQDSVRGVGYSLYSNSTAVEEATTGMIQSFNSDGFTVGSAGNALNNDGENYVAWCWRAGAGTTSINTDGSIDSVVSVNQDAGFSIVSYTGNGGNNTTIGHGLGKKPGLIIVKNRDTDSTNWGVWHNSEPNKAAYLDATTAFAVDSFAAYSFNEPNASGTYPTDSIFYVSASGRTFNSDMTNGSGDKQIAYCWAEIEGFSKFGSYVGNASADGPFVYCGFKPAWVMIKSSTVATNWYIFDNSRKPTNPITGVLFSNTSDVETFNAHDIDFLSNGFKVRQASGYGGNNNGATYIFAAFAESAFSYSNAK